MLKLLVRYRAFALLIFIICARSVLAANCDNACYDYNQVLESCLSDGSGDAYYSCVCNDSQFNTTVNECIACVGSDSAAAGVVKKCQTVAPDCSTACYEFSQILSGCGDTSSSGFKKCVCSAAYDINNSQVFNQEIQSCVSCENGGGAAEFWEAYCCAHGFGCLGASSQASSDAATMRVAAQTQTAASTVSTPTATATKSSEAGLVVSGGIGMLVGQLFAWILI